MHLDIFRFGNGISRILTSLLDKMYSKRPKVFDQQKFVFIHSGFYSIITLVDASTWMLKKTIC